LSGNEAGFSEWTKEKGRLFREKPGKKLHSKREVVSTSLFNIFLWAGFVSPIFDLSLGRRGTKAVPCRNDLSDSRTKVDFPSVTPFLKFFDRIFLKKADTPLSIQIYLCAYKKRANDYKRVHLHALINFSKSTETLYRPNKELGEAVL